MTLPQRRVGFTFRCHAGLQVVLRGGFYRGLSVLSWLEVMGAWRTVQEQPVGRGFCPDTDVKRFLGSRCGHGWQDTHLRVPGSGLR